MFKGKTFKDFVPGIIISFACSFLVCLYAPLELFFSNKNEFWFDIYVLGPIVLAMFFAAAAVSMIVLAVLYLINKKIYHIGILLEFAGLVCTYIQGNFMVGNLPPTDGTEVDWSKYTVSTVISVIMWIVVIAALLVLTKMFSAKKVISVINVVAGCLSLMLLVTLTTVCINNDGFSKKTNLTITEKNQMELSSDKNFIILVLDAVDGETFGNMMEENPQYKEIFNDFTFYSDAMSAYPFTKHSIPFMLTGWWYENQTDFNGFVDKTFTESKLFSNLESKNYKMGLYESELTLGDDNLLRFDNVIDTNGVTSIKDFIKLEIKLVGFKYAPYGLKRFCDIDTNEFVKLRGGSDEYKAFNSSNEDFYKNVKNNDFTLTDDKCFKFIHIEGGHVPFKYNENVEVIENGTYEDNLKACFTMTKVYLDKLKASGLYDNSVIMIMADHGYNMYETEGRQNPALFIKGINEKHDLSYSKAPVSYDDLQEAYARLLEGKRSDEVFDCKEGDKRARRYLFYYHLKDANMVEYEQTGAAKDMDSLKMTGRAFSLDDN